jgi:type IV secretion system protein TrbF
MRFKRPVQRYGDSPEPVTPYQKAAQIWDERIGSARVQAENWRLAAFGALGLSVLLSGGLIWQTTQSRVVPYVVEVDKLGGAVAIGPALAPYNPSDAEIAYYLARFISDVRSLSIDPIVVRKNWLEAYDYATDHGAVFLNDYARADDPFRAVGTRTISVTVTSVVRVSDTSFQVKWTEDIFEHETRAGTERWTAIVSIVRKEPRSAEVLHKNPLGLYVNGLNWSRELLPNEAR